MKWARSWARWRHHIQNDHLKWMLELRLEVNRAGKITTYTFFTLLFKYVCFRLQSIKIVDSFILFVYFSLKVKFTDLEVGLKISVVFLCEHKLMLISHTYTF